MTGGAAGRGRRWPWTLAAGLLVVLPFLLVRFPPIADLPQQTAQLRLLGEALAEPEGLYRVQWTTPYSLSYLVLGAAWAVVGAEHAGRIAMLLLGLAWVAGFALLAQRRGRPPASALLVAVLFFSHSLYWGFYSFAVGVPVFLGWLLLTLRRPPPERSTWREALLFCAAAALLYVSHALWLAAGALWLVLHSLLVARRPRLFGWRLIGWRLIGWRLIGTVPALALAAWWFRGLGGGPFATPPVWVELPWQRLLPERLAEAAFGGLRGPLEGIALAVLLLWALAGLWGHRRDLAEAVDRTLLIAGGLFFALALLLPDKYTNTIQFADRWMPVALALLLVALPPPPLGRGAARRLLALALVGAFCAVTAVTWQRFEAEEMSGLAPALAALPDEPRVLGLDLVRQSPRIEGSPFLQGFAYAQLYRGGRINFSFAEFASSLVIYRRPFSPPWTAGLEWYPQLLRRSDLDHFDHLLVNAPPAGHRRFTADPRLRPLTEEGRWRCYRILPAP